MTSKAEVLGELGGRGLLWAGGDGNDRHAMAGEENSGSYGNNSSGNQLKLSIGCEEDDESEDELRERYRAWTMSRQTPPIPQQPERVFRAEDEEFLPNSLPEDFGNELGQLLLDNQPIFQPHADNLVDEVWQIKPPKILRHWLFGALIGEGSYAKVKEVVHEQTLMRCAIKIFKDRKIRKIPNGFENVTREKEILRKIDHPNCIKMIEYFRLEERTKQYMVLDFCVASVQEVVETWENKRFPSKWAHYFYRQLMTGIEYLHSLSIIHKDIKPANLLISSEGLLKICDFGVAEQLPFYQDDDTCSVVQGTPKFQPPEVVGGHDQVFKGFAVDIWASGVTLYNLLSGEYPFEGDVIMRLYENICWQPLQMPKAIELEKDVQSLLHGLLEKDPKTRLKMDQVKHDAWFLQPVTKEKYDWSNFVKVKGTGSRLALSVYPSLAQLYEDQEMQSIDGEDEEINPLAPRETEPSANAPTQQPPIVATPPTSERRVKCLPTFLQCFR